MPPCPDYQEQGENKDDDEMFLADESRWEHMTTPADNMKPDVNARISELEEKYERL